MSFLSKLFIFIFGISLLSTDQCVAKPTVSQHEQLHFYSGGAQDQFAFVLLYELLDKQDKGFYLDIGAGHPVFGNNSYFFEKNFGWKGISIDIYDGFTCLWYLLRKNSLLVEDATQTNYQSILQHFPQVIDYLSLDIDRHYDLVLQRIPFNEHIFKIITIEHDYYRLGDIYRKAEREILSSLGYYLLCPDVMTSYDGKDLVFEDWWIHPSAFPNEILSLLTSLDLAGKNHDQLINIIRSCWNLNKPEFIKHDR